MSGSRTDAYHPAAFASCRLAQPVRLRPPRLLELLVGVHYFKALHPCLAGKLLELHVDKASVRYSPAVAAAIAAYSSP